MSDLAHDLVRRERKKKKKKPKASKGLLIGLISGGAALTVGVVVLIVVLNSGGGGGPKPDPAKKPLDAPIAYKRPLKEDEALVKLKEIGEAYRDYVRATTRGPKDHEQLAKFLKPELSAMIAGANPWIELAYNWLPGTLPEGAKTTLVAWEMQPFEGKRVVLYGDNTAKAIGEEEWGKTKRVNPGTGEVVPGPLVLEGGKTRLGGYVRPLERLEMENTLRNLGTSYVAYELEHGGRGPKELRELDCKDDRYVRGALDSKEGWLVFIWGAQRVADRASTIIAYERESIGGQRYVVFANGSFVVMSDDDFAKAPKAIGK